MTARSHPLPLGSVDFWRTQWSHLPPRPCGHRSTLTTQHHSPLKHRPSLLSGFILQLRKPQHHGREMTFPGPLGSEARRLGLVPRCLASLQDKLPLNHSTGIQQLREGAEGCSQWSSRVSLFMSEKILKDCQGWPHLCSSFSPTPTTPEALE